MGTEFAGAMPLEVHIKRLKSSKQKHSNRTDCLKAVRTSKMRSLRPQTFLLLLLFTVLSVSFLLLFMPSSGGEGVRVKREWPWEWIGKQACKTAANCKCKDGKSWAKCVKSEGYAASNCCDKNYVWACCGKKPKN